MRVLVDANVWLSYLLTPESEGTITAVVRTCLSADIDVVAPLELIAELQNTLTSKPYFRTRISGDLATQFVTYLLESAEVPSQIEHIADYVTDADDNYLVAYAILYDVDYIITGDALVRRLGQVLKTKIVTPTEFLHVLRDQDL